MSMSHALHLHPHSPGVGVGWRQPHYRELMERRPGLGFLEVHAENFFADGGAAPALLQSAREHYEISLHGVGLALGSAAGLDPWHLDQLARLVERVILCGCPTMRVLRGRPGAAARR